jgi:hypothetical protein
MAKGLFNRLNADYDELMQWSDMVAPDPSSG